MKSFKDMTLEVIKTCLETEVLIENILTEGKEKVIKLVPDGKGGFKKKKTFTCSGENQKYDPNSGKCVGVKGSEKANKKKGAKKRLKAIAKIPQSVKDKRQLKKDKAKARFGL